MLHKKTSIILVILIISFVFSACSEDLDTIKVVGNINDTKDVIENIFDKSGSQIESSNLQVWFEIPERWTKSQYETKCKEIAELLGLSNYDIQYIEDEDYYKIILSYEESNLVVYIIIDGMTTYDEMHRPMLLIDIETIENKKSLEYMKKIDEYLKDQEIEYEFSSLILGSYNKKLETDEMMKIAEDALENAEAKLVEGGIINEDIDPSVSLSGYTSKIPESLLISGNKININVALRYSTYEDKTFLWIATPLIMSDY